MACHSNTISSRINLNHGCNPCNPCDSCNRCACECQCDTPDYCDDGCLTIQPSDCSTYSGENIPCVGILKGDTMTEVIQKITAKLCDCCEGGVPSCQALGVSASAIGTNSFRINVSGLSLGDTWDLSLNNGLTYPYLGLTASFKDVTSLISNTAYIVKVRHNVTGTSGCFTVSEVATIGCTPLIGIVSMLGETSVRLTISNFVSGDLYDVSLDGGSTFFYTSISTSVLDITGLTPTTLYNVVIRRVQNTELEPCETNLTIQTYPCPSEVGSFTIVRGIYNSGAGTWPYTLTWTAVPGAMSYKIIMPVYGINLIVPATTLSYTFNLLPNLDEPGGQIYTELPSIGFCYYAPFFIYPTSIESCSTLSQMTVTSTTDNAYGPIFDIGYGCTGCSNVQLSYRKQTTPAAAWTNIGTFGASGPVQLIPTALAPLEFDTVYQFRFTSICQSGTDPHIDYVLYEAVS